MSQAILRSKPEPRSLPSFTVAVFALIFCATLALLSWALAALNDPASMPIRRVLIEGEFKYLDPAVLQKVVTRNVHGGFFHLDVAQLRRHLLDEPWIDDATIRRVWPETLRVSVIEQVPAARWGEQALLNAKGDIFAPSPQSIPPGLVRLDGPLGDENSVLRRYSEFAARLEPLGLVIAAVHLSPRHAWTLRLADGRRVELGRRQLHARLMRLIDAYPRGLEQVWPQIGSIDLRYPNGFAVSAEERSQPESATRISEQDKGDV